MYTLRNAVEKEGLVPEDLGASGPCDLCNDILNSVFKTDKALLGVPRTSDLTLRLSLPGSQIRENVVADTPGDYDLIVPQRGIWGTAGVGGWNIDKCVLMT